MTGDAASATKKLIVHYTWSGSLGNLDVYSEKPPDR